MLAILYNLSVSNLDNIWFCSSCYGPAYGWNYKLSADLISLARPGNKVTAKLELAPKLA